MNFRWPGRLLDQLEGEDPVPVWPMLRTRAQLEAVPKRTACPLCRPGLVYINKPQVAISWAYLPAAASAPSILAPSSASRPSR